MTTDVTTATASTATTPATYITGPLDHFADTALLDVKTVADLKVFGSKSKLDSDRSAGRGLPFIRLAGRVYYPAATLKAALAEAFAQAVKPAIN